MRIVTFLAALIVFAGVAQAGESVFFSEMNDIPVMPGLYELAAEGVVFDKPEGRIVEAAAAGEGVTPSEIMDFYAKTLPQMGWVRDGADEGYSRAGERLILRFEGAPGRPAVLRLSLRPGS